MALADEARRVAAQFDYSPDEVRRGTKEFIKQMRKPSPPLSPPFASC